MSTNTHIITGTWGSAAVRVPVGTTVASTTLIRGGSEVKMGSRHAVIKQNGWLSKAEWRRSEEVFSHRDRDRR